MLDYTNLFSPKEYEKNDKKKNTKIFSITKKFKMKKKKKCFICVSYRKIKNPQMSYIFKKRVLPIICSKCENWRWKRFKEEESIEILKIPGLTENI